MKSFDMKSFVSHLRVKINNDSLVEAMIWLQVAYFYYLGVCKISKESLLDSESKKLVYKSVFGWDKKNEEVYDSSFLEHTFVQYLGANTKQAKAFTSIELKFLKECGAIKGGEIDVYKN